ncbi:hypothetical protein HPG69_011380, partial [Diceros bicornis minor]
TPDPSRKKGIRLHTIQQRNKHHQPPWPLTDLSLMLSNYSLKNHYNHYHHQRRASNSKYALIRALQAVAQTTSYEVTFAIILLSVLPSNGSFTLPTLIITQEYLQLIFPSGPLTFPYHKTSTFIHRKQDTPNYHTYSYYYTITRRSSTTLIILTQMNNYLRNNKNNIILPTLIAIIVLLNLYFYI